MSSFMPPPTGSPLPFGGAAPSEMQRRRAPAAPPPNRPQEAEPLLRELLDREPFNVAALQLLAEVAQRAARLEDAQSLLGPAPPRATSPGLAPVAADPRGRGAGRDRAAARARSRSRAVSRPQGHNPGAGRPSRRSDRGGCGAARGPSP